MYLLICVWLNFGQQDYASLVNKILHHWSTRLCIIGQHHPPGEWLALGAATAGQLLVWEWRSETYVLKQQGHFHDVAALAYSPDGGFMVTGADDAKVWGGFDQPRCSAWSMKAWSTKDMVNEKHGQTWSTKMVNKQT